MGAGAADIAQIVSEVRARLRDLEPAPVLEDPEAARFRLFDSITAFLKSAANTQPLVLVLDDLHWADEPSLLLLQFVVGELTDSRLFLIGAYRDVELSRRHPLSRTLGELTRERAFQRVLLRGLRQQDVGHFIELTSGITPPQGLVRAVHTQTEGNPLFVNEVVRLLVQEGELTPERLRERKSWTVRIPEGVREVIGRRLDRLSERCNQTLTIASVIGREFTLQQLNRLIDDLSEDRLLEVLEEALAARVIEELPRAVGRCQFTHALIQETLAEELSLTRRVRLHANIAQALEEMYGTQAEAHAAELAYHFGQAEAVLGTEKVVKYSLLAGEKTLSAYAYEEATEHFQRGLATKEGQPVDAETAALLFGMGRAQAATLERHQFQEAVDSLRRAFDYYVEVGDTGQAVAVAQYPFPHVHGPRGLAELIGRALQLVPSESHEAGRLLSRYGLFVSFETGDYDAAQETFDRALAVAQREKDAALELRTLTCAAIIDWIHLRNQEGLEKSLRAIELSQRVDDPHAEFEARELAGQALNCMGEAEKARVHASAALALAEKLRQRYALSFALALNAQLSARQGDWKSARDFSDRGLAVDPQEFRLIAPRIRLEYEVGQFNEGTAYLDRLLEVVGPIGPQATYRDAIKAVVIACVGSITGVAERFDDAEAAAKAVLSSPAIEHGWRLFARMALALMAVQRSDVQGAAEQYAALESQRGTMPWGGFVATDRLLGLVAQITGRLDRAIAHFEEALAFSRKAGYRPEVAWTCCDYADALLQRNGPGDRKKAMALLDEALAISRELGMRPLMERVLSRRNILKA